MEGCLVEHCRSHGLHPGTSLRGGVFSGNVSRHNGGDGLYFCAQVVGSWSAETCFTTTLGAELAGWEAGIVIVGRNTQASGNIGGLNRRNP